MRLLFILLSCTVLLSACSSKSTIDDAAANQFQSLTKSQQASYWAAVRRQHDSIELEKIGIQVFNNGEEYQLNIPAKLLFIDTTPMSADKAAVTYQKIAQLINGESTTSIRILAYTSTGNKQRDFSLTEDWAQTVQTNLRENRLATALISAAGRGTCVNYPSKNPLNSRIEIYYRIQKID